MVNPVDPSHVPDLKNVLELFEKPITMTGRSNLMKTSPPFFVRCLGMKFRSSKNQWWYELNKVFKFLAAD